MAEGKLLQVIQWGSNYIGEQIPSTKILLFIGLRVYCQNLQGEGERESSYSVNKF